MTHSQTGTPEPDRSHAGDRPVQPVGAVTDRPNSGQDNLLFWQLFKASADAMLLLENGIVIDCNAAALEMMRCKSKAELLSRHLAQLSPEVQPDRRSSCDKASELLGAMAHRSSHRFEWVYQRGNGEVFWVEVLLTQMEMDGQPILHAVWREIGDRKAIEAELYEHQQMLRSVYEAVDHSITLVDVGEDGEFRFVGWNPATERIIGISSEAIVGKTPEALMGEGHGRMVRQDYRRCLAAGTSITYEEYLPFDGRDFWWLTTLNPLKDDRGRIYRIVVTSFDITDRKAAEAALQQQEALYRSIFETINEGIVLTELETGRTVESNPAAHQMHGYPYEEFLQLSPPDLLHPDSVPLFTTFLETVSAGDRFSCEAVGLHRNGTPINLEVTAVPLLLRGKPHSLTLVRDVTVTKSLEAGRKATETALIKSESRFRSLIENAASMIFEIGADGSFIYASPSFSITMGYAPSEIEGRSFAPFVYPEDLPICETALQTVIGQEQSIVGLEYRVICKDGAVRWHRANIAPLRDADRKIISLLGVADDVSDRKTSENALQEANVLLNSVLETIPGLFFVKDRQGQYLISNSNLAEFFNRSIPEILGRTDADLLPPAIAAHVMAKDQQVFEGSTTQRYEEVVRTHGIDCTYLTTKAPLYDAEGALMGLIGIAIDITDRKKAEQAQARLTAILEATSDFVAIADVQGRNLYMNRAGYRLLEIPPEEDTVGMPIDAMLTEESKQTVLEQGIPTAIHQGIWKGESIYLAPSGREIPVSQVIIAHKAADGTPEYLSTIARDITEQKQAELALQRRAQRERLLNRITSQVRCSLDFDTILTTAVEEVLKFMQVDSCTFAWYCADTADSCWQIVEHLTAGEQPSLLGRYPVKALGSLAEQLLSLNPVSIEDTSQVKDTTVRQLFESLGYAASLNLPMQTRSGLIGVLSCQHKTTRCWIEDEVKLLQAVKEQLAIALNQAELYAQSQTKAQELEQALQELQRTQLQMIQSEKMSSLGQLVAGVAHEINNPVNFIYGNLSPAEQYMQDLLNLIHLYATHYPDPPPTIQEEIEAIDLQFVMEDLPRLLSSMKMGADRIRQIVRSLRTFSRLDEAEYKPVDIHEGIDSTLVILENRLKAQPDHPGIEVVKQYSRLPLVECYAGQLNQVFMNILTNALDALEERDQKRSPQEMSQAPSQIVIRTEPIDDDRVAICIADNGPGIPEAVRQRIFDPFFTTKPIGKGTGMGMSISYQIITENHRGTLKCVSSSGQGAEFVIEIPLKQNQ